MLVALFALTAITIPAVAIAQVDGGAAVEEPTVATEPEVLPDPEPEVLPDPAPAVVDEPSASALSNLSGEIMNIIIPIFGTFIAGLATLVLNWIRKRFKLQVSDAQVSAWSTLARKAALRGAEWSRKKTKELTDGKKIPGPDVLEVAANWAIEVGKAAGLPRMAREKLEGLIESELFELRVNPAIMDRI